MKQDLTVLCIFVHIVKFNMSAMWIVLIYSILTVNGTDSFLLDRIDTTKEIYFRRISNLKTYDFIIPIVYVVPIRDSNQLFARSEDLLDLIGNYTESTNNLAILRGYLNHRKDIITDFEFENSNNRNKRSIMGATNAIRDFFGDVLVACCRVLTYRDGSKIVNNQKSLAEHYNVLKSAMIDDHKNLFRVNEIISDMNKNLAQQTKLIKQKFKSFEDALRDKVNINEFVNLENEIHHQDFFQNLINTIALEMMRLTQMFSACKAHKATQSILAKDKLIDDLTKLEISSWKINYELVIDIKNINEYYHLELLDCNMHGNVLEMELKVPIVRKNTKFEVYEIKQIPFFWESKICHIQIENKLIISDSKNSILKSMTDSDLTACDINKKLCKIPQFRVINSFDSCITAIFREEPQSEIQTKCHFHCEMANPKEIVATQLSENSFAISNFQTLLAVNSLTGEKETAIFNKSFGGSYILSVPCTTEILNINDGGTTQTIVPMGIPCFNSELNQLSLAKIVPFSKA